MRASLCSGNSLEINSVWNARGFHAREPVARVLNVWSLISSRRRFISSRSSAANKDVTLFVQHTSVYFERNIFSIRNYQRDLYNDPYIVSYISARGTKKFFLWTDTQYGIAEWQSSMILYYKAYQTCNSIKKK